MAVTPLASPTTSTGAGICCCAVAQLTSPVIPPAHDLAARSKRTGVPKATCDGGHAAAQPDHIHRRAALVGCAVAQLAILIPPPALHPAARDQRTGVISACGDGGYAAGQPGYVHRRAALVGGAVAQLTRIVIPLALDPAAGTNRTSVIVAC